MANVDRPQGLKPIGYLGGSPWNGAANMYFVDGGTESNIIGVGDLVKLAGSAGAAGEVVNGIDVEGMPTVTRSAAGDLHVGVVIGFLPNQDNLMLKHRAASTDRIALVVDDPNVVFEIQEVSGGTALTAAAVGLNANIATVADASTTTGMSVTELDNATEAATADLDLKILGMVKRPDNAIGEHCKWLVQINTHSYGNSAGNTGL
jgi:hypothetical protein